MDATPDKKHAMTEAAEPVTFASSSSAAPTSAVSDAQGGRRDRIESLRWWIKLVVQPLIFLAACIMLVVMLGITQKFGWISSTAGTTAALHGGGNEDNVRYICPMMCTPPQKEPGRCPVCRHGTGPHQFGFQRA